VKTEGTDAWFKRDLKELLPDGFTCPDCGKAEFEKTKDILDVWFDSGVSYQAVIKSRLKKKLPIDLYLEGSDQHRGWFQSSLILSGAIDSIPPFKAVLTHGFNSPNECKIQYSYSGSNVKKGCCHSPNIPKRLNCSR